MQVSDNCNSVFAEKVHRAVYRVGKRGEAREKFRRRSVIDGDSHRDLRVPYRSVPKTGSSAPYLHTTLLIAAIAATSDICDRKLQRPSETILPTILPFGLNEPRSSFTLFRRQTYQTARNAVMICPITARNFDSL